MASDNCSPPSREEINRRQESLEGKEAHLELQRRKRDHTIDDEVYRRQRSYNMWRKGKRTVDDDRRFVQIAPEEMNEEALETVLRPLSDVHKRASYGYSQWRKAGRKRTGATPPDVLLVEDDAENFLPSHLLQLLSGLADRQRRSAGFKQWRKMG